MAKFACLESNDCYKMHRYCDTIDRLQMDRQENRQTDELMDEQIHGCISQGQLRTDRKIKFREDSGETGLSTAGLASDICIVTLTAKKKASYIQFV